jgi:predicted ATP-dependent endonuclease of OLD family
MLAKDSTQNLNALYFCQKIKSRLLHLTDLDDYKYFLDKFDSFKRLSNSNGWQKDLEDFWKEKRLRVFNHHSSTGVNGYCGVESNGIATLNTICKLFWFVMENKGLELILIEEPEVGLHPKAQSFTSII